VSMWSEGLGLGSVGVRRDWPDGRHDFVGFTMSPVDAVLFVARDRFRWRRTRFRPVHSVVGIGLRDLSRHRGLCGRNDCPSPGRGSVLTRW
jgi:hypothetical protein